MDPIQLKGHGEYEIGLAEIMFPTLIANVRDCWVKVDKGKEFGRWEYGERRYLTDGFYSDVERFMTLLLNILTTTQNKVSIELDAESRIVTFYLFMPLRLEMSRKLADILGFDDSVLVSNDVNPKKVGGNQALDLFRGLEHIYVYSDTCQDVVLGHVKAPLLRVINTNMTAVTKQQCITFSKISYVPMSKRYIDTVLVYLRLNDGQSVPFMAGSCILTLQIRKRNRLQAL